jgi:predicted 2-oxoglutarate/Fe(II)-dependent dioxygenase YbiX
VFDDNNIQASNVFVPAFVYGLGFSDKADLRAFRGRAHLLMHLFSDAADWDSVASRAEEVRALCRAEDVDLHIVITGDFEQAGQFPEALLVPRSEPFFLELPASIPHSSSLNYACVVDTSGKICWVSRNLTPPCARLLLDKIKGRDSSGSEVAELRAPVLLVDNVFTSDQCDQIIAHFKSRTSAQSKVGDRVNTASKIRDDVFLNAEASKAIDAITVHSLLPEMQRVFGFVGTHRETYKVGCYRGGEGGFYKAHRDKYRGSKLKEQSYRQYSYTINLNDNFDGGGIYFPEYSPDFYKVPKGGAIVFPSHLLHGVYPVRSGERYVLVCFAFDEHAQRMRHAHLRDFDPDNAEQRLSRSYAIEEDIFATYDVYKRSLERISPSLTIPHALIDLFEGGGA